MVHQLVSSRQILAKVYRDWKPSSQDWGADAIEWIGEVLLMIRTYNMLEKTHAELTVASHRAPLPCDLDSIVAVAYNGYRLPYRSDVRDARALEPTYSPTGLSAYVTEALRGVTPLWLGEPAPGATYSINPGYIVTSFESGKVTVFYNRFPTDEEGYPMIPDDYYLREACALQIVKNLQRRGDVAGNPFDTEDAVQRYARKATSTMSMWSPDQAERFLAGWARLVPNRTTGASFFAGGEQSERLPSPLG